jgi:hypothetical protein
MLARRLTTILPAVTFPEALDTTRLHRVAGLTGDRTTLVTTRPCRAPHHTAPMWGGSAAVRSRGRARDRGRTLACAFWMHGPSAHATSWTCCGSHLRRVFYKYNLPHVLNFKAVTDLALRVMAGRDAGTAR